MKERRKKTKRRRKQLHKPRVPITEEDARGVPQLQQKFLRVNPVTFIAHIYLKNGLVVFPTSKCKLRLLKLERIKDFLLMEEEFIRNQEILRPREEQNEVLSIVFVSSILI